MQWEMEMVLCYVVLDVSVVQQIVMFKQYCGMEGVKKFTFNLVSFLPSSLHSKKNVIV